MRAGRAGVGASRSGQHRSHAGRGAV